MRPKVGGLGGRNVSPRLEVGGTRGRRGRSGSPSFRVGGTRVDGRWKESGGKGRKGANNKFD